MYGTNKLLHGWLVCTIFIIHLLHACLSFSTRIQIVRTRQPCSNLCLNWNLWRAIREKNTSFKIQDLYEKIILIKTDRGKINAFQRKSFTTLKK